MPWREKICAWRHDHIGDERFRRDAALDQTRRRGRLRHGVPARASVFGTAGDDHAEDRRDFVEAFGPLFADHVHGLAAAGAERVFRLDDLFDPRQMRGKRAPVRAAFLRPLAFQAFVFLLFFRIGLGSSSIP